MNLGIPPHSFFQVSFPCRFRQNPPVIDGILDDWDRSFLVPDLMGLGRRGSFADFFMAWNQGGLFFALKVKGSATLQLDTQRPLLGDGLQVWIDTRDVRTASRGSRYCHHFCFWPGVNGAQAAGRQFRLRRARAQARLCGSDQFFAASRVNPEGYELEIHLPGSALTGFDPEENSRLGFTYLVKDQKLGRQFLTADETLPVAQDPSLWGTAVLVREAPPQ